MTSTSAATGGFSASVRNKMQAGQFALGTWNLLDDPDGVEIICRGGFDFVIHDMEHGSHSLGNVKNMVRAAHGCGKPLFLRPPGIDFGLIQRVLDAGCDGLMVPNIQSVQDAKDVVAAALYPPEGNRGLSPYTRGMGYDGNDVSNRMAQRNQDCFIGILIEGQLGMDALDDILETCGKHLDVIYIGLYDLAKQIGSTDDLMSEAMKTSILTIVEKVRAGGAQVGMLTNSDKMTRFARAAGVNFLAYKNDTAIFFDAIEQIVTATKSVDGE